MPQHSTYQQSEKSGGHQHDAHQLSEKSGAHQHGTQQEERKFSQVRPLLKLMGNVSRGGHPVDLVEDHGFHKQLGGAFSLMCTLRMDRLNPWQRVFDFSFKADIDSITAGSIDNSTHLHFTVFKGKNQRSVHVFDFFELGKKATALFTVSKAGRMRVWKDGELVGEIEGHSPYFNDRPHLVIGGHYLYKKQFFRGVIGSVKIWNKEVIWPPKPIFKPANLVRQPMLSHNWGVVVGMPPPSAHQQPTAAPSAGGDSAGGRVLVSTPSQAQQLSRRDGLSQPQHDFQTRMGVQQRSPPDAFQKPTEGSTAPRAGGPALPVQLERHGARPLMQVNHAHMITTAEQGMLSHGLASRTHLITAREQEMLTHAHANHGHVMTAREEEILRHEHLMASRQRQMPTAATRITVLSNDDSGSVLTTGRPSGVELSIIAALAAAALQCP